MDVSIRSVRCHSTDRSWQDFDFSQKATLGFFFAIILSRSRRAFVGMLSRRTLQLRRFRRLLTSFGSLRRRSCLTMPWNASQTLCCMAAEVSINLQSNTAAQARPSRREKSKSHVRRGGKSHTDSLHQTRTVSPHR